MYATNETVLVPSVPLRRWITDVRVAVAGADDQPVVTHLPDTATTLVFRTTAAQQRDLFVVGPRTRASYHAGKDIPFCLKVRLRPGGARALLGVPVSEIVDRVVPLGGLWGGSGERLARELADLDPDALLILKHVEAALLARLAAQKPGDLARSELLRAATEAMSTTADQRPQRVPTLAKRLAVSERHLRNLFTEGVGLSPKWFARIDRVRTVLASAGHPHWGQLATAAGYYDQSHMTAEFRRMMGAPPRAFFAGRRPTPQPC